MENIKTIIPFDDNDIDSYLDNVENYFFEIDFEESQYKGKKFLNYIYNSGINCDVLLREFNEDTENLLIEYIKSDKLLSIPILNDIWVSILYQHLTGKIIDENYSKIISNHKDVVEELLNVFGSLINHIISKVSEKEENLEKNKFTLIGTNYISLRNSDMFWELVKELMSSNRKRFEYEEFEEFNYDGRKVATFFLDDFNPITAAITSLQQ